ncbi:MAG: hypothetical protein DWH77_00195 [Planctomycetota bacterium]|nr:MAG: hypothetical protein DWH77_00195 [Planctomycetota bacterium]
MQTSDLRSPNGEHLHTPNHIARAMTNLRNNILLCALLISGFTAQNALAQEAPDPTRAQILEEDFLRGISDLGLAHALEDLELTEPSAAAADRTTTRLRSMALSRLILTSPSTLLPDRVIAFDQLRKTRKSLIKAYANDPRSILWFTDAAEDEFVLGFLGIDGGVEAIAGAPVAEIVPRASASLDRIEQHLDSASTAEQTIAKTSIPAGSLLAQRLEDDADGRRPMLAAAVKAFRLAIDRSTQSAEQQRDRQAKAALLLKTITQLRTQIPPRLRPEADLAEVAAASVALQSEIARFGAARVMLVGDPMLTVLTKILAAESLMNDGHGIDALKQLSALLVTPNLPTALRLLTADALVRSRVFAGKSATTEQSLSPWIMTLRASQPSERAGVRKAVLERLAGVLRGVRIDTELPPLAMIAIARDNLLQNPNSSAEFATLNSFSNQSIDAEAQSSALEVLAEIHSSKSDWPAAADDYRRFAECAPQEPMALTSMQTALDIELALDRANPNGREANLERTLALASTRFAELPSRPSTVAQWEALKARRMIQDFLAQSTAPSADQIAALSQAAARIDDLDRAARNARLDPGSRVTATAYAARVAADFLSSSHEEAMRTDEIPTIAAWNAWTIYDAQRILRLRLERAARHGTPPRHALDKELAGLPASFMTAENPMALTCIVDFAKRQVDLAASMSASGNANSMIAAQRALDALEAWENLFPSLETHSNSALTESFARLAADAAIYENSWDSAVARSDAIAAKPWATIDDFRRLTEALSSAEIAANSSKNIILRDALRTRAMASARDLAGRVAQGSKEWWISQVIQMRIAQESGRGGESVQARLARLRALDPALGGEPHRSALEKFSSIASPPSGSP